MQRLERSIRRLESCLHTLNRRRNQFTYYRLAAFTAGAASTWFASTVGLPSLFWTILFFSLGLFFFIVYLHRREDHRIERFEAALALRKNQLARLSLDWERIPSPAAFDRTPLQIDLDLAGPKSLHHLVDLAVSHEGSLLLAQALSQESPVMDQVTKRQQIIKELVRAPRFRDRLLIDLRLISPEPLKGANLLRWLKIPPPASSLAWAVPTAALLIAAADIMLILNVTGTLPAYWLLPLLLYLVIYYWHTSSINTILGAIIDLEGEIEKFSTILKHLENYSYTGKPHLKQFCMPFLEKEKLPSRNLRSVRLLSGAAGARMNPFFGLFLNLLLPWDFLTAYFSRSLQRKMASLFPEWVETWYHLEGMISLASFAALHPEYTFPEINPQAEPILQAERLGHPLLAPGKKIANDLTIESLGAIGLITGSNMSGKSTFIKTVGINLCLANAGGTVDAAVFKTIPVRLHTCIRITDSIADGFSYFYAEVRCLKGLIEKLRQNTNALPVFFLIDEIFRGTNNRERLIGSQAYIRALAALPGAGLIATHDLELAQLEKESPSISNYHFSDTVEGGRLVFDYHIRPGPSPTTNALKIMEMEGLPVEQNLPE